MMETGDPMVEIQSKLSELDGYVKDLSASISGNTSSDADYGILSDELDMENLDMMMESLNMAMGQIGVLMTSLSTTLMMK